MKTFSKNVYAVKGRAEEKSDIVCKLYKNGMPAETIARMLEIPLESVMGIIG